MDGRAWWAAVHGVTKSRTRLSNFTFTFHFHALEKEMASHSSVHAWRIPGTAEPGGLLSMGSYRVGHDWSDLAAAAELILRSHKNSHSVITEYRMTDSLRKPHIPLKRTISWVYFLLRSDFSFSSSDDVSFPICLPLVQGPAPQYHLSFVQWLCEI